MELPLLRQVAGGHPRTDAREPLTLAFRRDWLTSFLGRPLPEESPEEVAYTWTAGRRSSACRLEDRQHQRLRGQPGSRLPGHANRP